MKKVKTKLINQSYLLSFLIFKRDWELESELGA